MRQHRGNEVGWPTHKNQTFHHLEVTLGGIHYSPHAQGIWHVMAAAQGGRSVDGLDAILPALRMLLLA